MAMSLGSFASRVVATKVVATDGTGDFTDIQAALDDLPTSGGVVFVKEGTYTITTALLFKVNNTSLVGTGRGTEIKTTSNITMIDVNNKRYGRVDNLLLNGAGTGNASNDGIKLNFADYFIFHCWIENCGNRGIFVDGADSVSIMGNILRSNKGEDIFNNGGDKVITLGNLLEDSAKDSIILSGSSNDIVSDNTINNPTSSGIVCDGSSENAIRGNAIITPGSHGIHIKNSALVIEITGNRVTFAPTNFDGVFLDASDECVIVGNTCRNNGRYGINISNSTSDNNVVVGNICLSNTTAGINDAGTGTQIAHNITA